MFVPILVWVIVLLAGTNGAQVPDPSRGSNVVSLYNDFTKIDYIEAISQTAFDRFDANK